MNEDKISEEVLKALRDNIGYNEIMLNFLIDLLYEEAIHLTGWKFSKKYREKIEHYIKDWENTHED